MLESLLRETDWLDALRRTDEPVLLYGMGSGADKILALLSGAGDTRRRACSPSDGFVRGHSYRGMRVLTRREAEERFGSFTALLAFGLEGGPDEALRAVASRHRLLAPNLPVYGAGRLDKAYIRQNAARILYVYERLADDYSKRLFTSCSATTSTATRARCWLWKAAATRRRPILPTAARTSTSARTTAQHCATIKR